MLKMKDAASELVWLLADEGVQHLFFNPGTDTAPVQEALAAARAAGSPHPGSVLCLHEHVALSAAIAHHALSGRPQALQVHVDAGTLNVGGALHNAQRNRTPVVVMAGRSPYSTDPAVPGHRDNPIQWPQEEPDQAASMRAYGRWVMEVPRGRELGRIVRRAFQVAQSEPRGPAYVMLPRESLMDPPAAARFPRLRPPRPPAPDPGGLAEVTAALAGAARPVIVTATTGRTPAAVASLARIAELLGAPVVDQRDRFNLPIRHPLYAGGLAGDGFLREADCVLVLDTDVPWVPAAAAPPAGATIVQVDIDPAKVTMPSWAFPVAVALEADSALALPMLEAALTACATPERRAAWRTRREEAAGQLREVHEAWRRRAESEAPADLPDAHLAALERSLPRDALVLEEAVTNRPACGRQVDREPGAFISSGAPSLGWALGAGLGAALAAPGRPVVAVCGDGSFHFGIPTAALWSAHRAGAPFLTVVLDNGGYYASKRPVVGLYPEGASVAAGRFPETEITDPPDIVAIARACGGDGAIVSRPGEMASAVEAGLATVRAGRCAVIDVKLPWP
jgi:acetolactate synthase I/II/III large subunit